MKTAWLEPAKPPDNHNAMSAEGSRHGQPVEAGCSTYYSASPSSCKALQSTTLTPARELDRRRHHTGLALGLACGCLSCVFSLSSTYLAVGAADPAFRTLDQVQLQRCP